MELTRHSDYALRTLLYLALYPDQQVTINDIAHAYGISKNHLMKVVHRLGKEGYVNTFRGNQGGMRLARDPSAISVGHVVLAMGEKTMLVDCEGQKCPITSVCKLKNILNEASQAMISALNRYTLADIVTQPQALAEFLYAPVPIVNSHPMSRKGHHSTVSLSHA